MPPHPLAPGTFPPWRRALPRLALRAVVIAMAVWAVHLVLGLMRETVGAQNAISDMPIAWAMLLLLLLGYALLLAIPFMPGVEVGIAVLLLNGPQAAPLVYLATCLGLALAYGLGRALPLRVIERTFRDLHLTRAASWAASIATTPPDRRLARLRARLPRWLAPFAVKYRYATIALLLNVPGNMAIGGGGGIMMLAGLSRLFHPRPTLIAIAIGVLPVPLAVWAFGTAVLG